MPAIDIINCIAGCFAAIGTVGATIFALYSACGPHLGRLKFNFRPKYNELGLLDSIDIDLKNTGKEKITIYHICIEAHNAEQEGTTGAHSAVLIDTAQFGTKKVQGFHPIILERSDGIIINSNSMLTIKIPQGVHAIELRNGHILSVTVTDSRGRKKKSYKLKVQDGPTTKS